MTTQFDQSWFDVVVLFFLLVSFVISQLLTGAVFHLINHFDLHLITCIAHSLEIRADKTLPMSSPCQHDQMNRSYVARQRADVPRPDSASGSRMAVIFS